MPRLPPTSPGGPACARAAGRRFEFPWTNRALLRDVLGDFTHCVRQVHEREQQLQDAKRLLLLVP